jgi:hypothetical protein
MRLRTALNTRCRCRSKGLQAANPLTVLQFLEHAFQHAIKDSNDMATLLALGKILHALQRTTHSRFTPEDYRAYKKYRANKLKWLAATRAIDLAFHERKKPNHIQRLWRKKERLFHLYTASRNLYTQRQSRTRLKLMSSLLIQGRIHFPAVELAVGESEVAGCEARIADPVAATA